MVKKRSAVLWRVERNGKNGIEGGVGEIGILEVWMNRWDFPACAWLSVCVCGCVCENREEIHEYLLPKQIARHRKQNKTKHANVLCCTVREK